MVPEGWTVAPIGTLGEVVAGKAKNARSEAPERPYLRVANVFDGRIDTSDVLRMPFTDAEFARYMLKVGDVLLNEGQSLELVGRCSMYRGDLSEPCAIQNALIRFRADSSMMTQPFAEQLFRWCQKNGTFATIATQTTSIAHLGVKRLSGLEVRVPPLPEQRKIAAILTAVDETIEKTEAVIEQLGVVKKAMMQELLTRGLPGRHTRFKKTDLGEIPEDWEICTVREAGEVVAGKAKNKRLDAPNRPYLRVANVFDGRIDISDVLQMPFTDAEFARYRLRAGDILLNEGQSLELVGRCAMYREEYPDSCAIQNALIRFRPGRGLRAAFAEQVFRWYQHSGRFASVATQTTSIAHLGVQRFASMFVSVPQLEEQDKIMQLLDGMDTRIRAEKATVAALSSTKSALMSVLLTGELRVTPDEDAA